MDLWSSMQWLLPSGLFGSVLLSLWNKFVRIRPQVILRIEDRGSNQSADGPNRYKFVWHRRLVLHNDSSHKARRIRLVSTEGIANWHFKGSLPDTVEPDAKQTWSFSIHHSEEREKVIALCGQAALQRHELAMAFLPHVAGHAEIIVAYGNEKDTTFYTRFVIDGDLQKSTLHWRRPKLTIENR